MSVLRRNPLTGEWILLAPERSRRPHAYIGATRSEDPGERCPFCPGNESDTPPEIWRLGHDTLWDLRLVPNKYPAVQKPGSVEPNASGLSAVGFHEVLIETADHEPSVFSSRRLGLILGAYVERLREHMARPEISCVTIFKNQGAAAGASIAHPHSQIIALPVVPQRLAQMSDVFRRDTCPLCTMVEEESRSSRLIASNRSFLLLAPFASRFPYEMWIVPAQHHPSLSEVEVPDLARLATIMHSALFGLDRRLGAAPLNWSIQNAPVEGGAVNPRFHWFLSLHPRLTGLGGFELGSGSYINIVEPEQVAEEIRGAIDAAHAEEQEKK